MKLLTVGYAMRASLKTLKKLSKLGDPSSPIEYREDVDKITEGLSTIQLKRIKDDALEVLMIWSIFATYFLWERHFRVYVKWIPGYYYLESLFLGVIAMPKLRLTRLVFFYGLVPGLNLLNRYFSVQDIPSFYQFMFALPIYALLLLFPSIIEPTEDEVITNITENDYENGKNKVESTNEIIDNKYDNKTITVTDTGATKISNIEKCDTPKSPFDNGKRALPPLSQGSGARPLSLSPGMTLIFDDTPFDDVIKIRVQESSRRLTSLIPALYQLESETRDKSSLNSYLDDHASLRMKPNSNGKRSSLQSMLNVAKQWSPLSPSRFKSPSASPSKESSSKLSPLQEMSQKVVCSVRNILSGDMASSLFDVNALPSNSILRYKRRITLLKESQDEYSTPTASPSRSKKLSPLAPLSNVTLRSRKSRSSSLAPKIL